MTKQKRPVKYPVKKLPNSCLQCPYFEPDKYTPFQDGTCPFGFWVNGANFGRHKWCPLVGEQGDVKLSKSSPNINDFKIKQCTFDDG